METESAFTDRFILMVINRSYWSGKEEGQTGAETCWKKEKRTSVKGWELVMLSSSVVIPFCFF